MISEQRRLELEKLAAAVNAAHDRYYCEMDEADFADEFAEFADDDGEDEVYTAWYRAILRQREIGFDAFAAEVRQAFDNAAPTGEELHELMAHYNYDDGAGLPAWVVAHPACTLATAQQVYWLCHPADFYQDHGSPQNAPEGIGYDIAQLIVAIEEKARSGGFVESPGQTAELRGDESIAEAIAYASLDKIPAALWQGLA